MTVEPGSGRGRIDWDAAFEYFATLGAVRSFGKVARMFGVSDVAVGKHARANGWDERVRELDRKTQAEIEKRVVRDRAVRLADTINLVDSARSEILERLEKGDADVRLSDMPALIKLELLLEGEATDRVEITEIRTVIHQVFAIVDQYLPVEHRPAFIEAISQLPITAATAPVLEREAEEVDGS